MVVWLYEGTGGTATRKSLYDPIAAIGTIRQPVNVIYAYQGGVRTLVWSRAPMTITATPSRWDTIAVVWTQPGAGADSYVLMRNGTQVYAGPSLTFTDTLRDPATSYTYVAKAIRAGAEVSQVTATATTPARTLTLAVQSADYSSVTIKWTDAVVGSITKYRIKRNSAAIATVNAIATTYTDSGLTYNQTYSYQVEALRGPAGSEAVVPPVSNIVSQTLIARPPMVLTKGTTAWDTINLSWTDPAGDAATYMLQRGSTVIGGTIAGATRSYSDAGVLLPSSGYAYTLTAKDSAGKTIGTATLSAATPARTAPTLTATAASWNSMSLSWPDADRRSITHYQVFRGYWTEIEAASTDTLSSDSGLAASTGYHYLVRAWRDTEQILPDIEADGTTPVRPTATATAYSNVGWENATGWTGATQRYLTGPNIAVPVGGTFTNMVVLVYSYTNNGVMQNFRGEPKINGVAGPQQVYKVGRSHTNWSFNLGFAAGTFTTGITVGGTNWGQAEWSPKTGAAWNYNVHVHALDYWYYTALTADDEGYAEQRAVPWWDDILEGRETHTETWSDNDGTITRARVLDKASDEVLIEWEAPA